jgi:hypothetical protein
MPNKKDMATATDWLKYFGHADIMTKVLADISSERGKTIRIGNYLSPNVDRTVPIQVKGRSGSATLRRKKGSAHSKLYYFEVVWDTPAIAEETQADTIVEQQPVVDHSTTTIIASPTEPVTVRNPAGKGSNPGNDEMWD